jgi:Na+/H+-dicarboxylate symporter
LNKLFKNLTFWVLVFGIFGYVLASFIGDPAWAKGAADSEIYNFILFLKTVFLSLLKMLIAPMIFLSLMGGLLNIGGKEKLKTMGKSVIIYYLSTTAIAIVIGLGCVFFIHPWESGSLKNMQGREQTSVMGGKYVKPKKYISEGSDSIILILKKLAERAFQNPFEALTNNNILGIATMSFLFGLAMVLTLKNGSSIPGMIEEANLLIHTILGWVIKTTPIGVFAIAFDFQLKATGSILTELLSFFLLVVGATLFHGIVVLPTIAYFFGGVAPLTFFKKAARPLLVALSTSSSSATLPVSMSTCEEEFGVSSGVSGFVFPLGATMNMDGTALFEGIAAIFLANLYGVDLSGFSIFIIFFMSMISSIGAPGMPSGSMAGMQMVLLGAGIPLEGIGILLVVERPLDAIRTAVNVEGDMIGALIAQKQLKEV